MILEKCRWVLENLYLGGRVNLNTSCLNSNTVSTVCISVVVGKKSSNYVINFGGIFN